VKRTVYATLVVGVTLPTASRAVTANVLAPAVVVGTFAPDGTVPVQDATPEPPSLHE
jgi:hypothetical protein